MKINEFHFTSHKTLNKLLDHVTVDYK